MKCKKVKQGHIHCLFWFIYFRVYIKDNNIRTEPKFIVFLSQLLLLFQFCPLCKASNPMVEAKAIGTMVEVRNVCINPECRKELIWRSQPSGTKIPAGNFLLRCISHQSASNVCTYGAFLLFSQHLLWAPRCK